MSAQRLPIPGQDDGTWGSILNSFLEVSFASDGTLNTNTVGTAQLQANAVTNAQLDTLTQTAIAAVADKYTKPGNGIPVSDLSTAVQTSLSAASSAVQSVNGKSGTAVSLSATDVSALPMSTALAGLADTTAAAGAANNQVLTYSSTSSSWIPATVTSTTVNNATSSAPGIVQLAGDLAGGNATAPQVTSTHLSSALPVNQGGTGATTQNFIDLTSNQTIAGNKNLTGTTTAASLTTTNLQVTGGTLSNGNVLTSDGSGNATWAAPTTGTATSNATTTNPGLVQLSGDLSGTATSPTVAKLNGITLPGSTPTAGQALVATSNSATSWETLTGGQFAVQAQLVSAQVAVGTYSGLPGSIDSITVTDGMVVMLNAESNAVNNGPWVVHAGGAWTRPASLPTGTDATGTIVFVQGGAQNTATIWFLQGLAPNIVDTNNLHWTQIRIGTDRGFVNGYSLYNVNDIVILSTNQRVLITKPVQASSNGAISSGNYVVLQYLQNFDIRMYGAKVDATTDDTAAIQAAINAAANSTNTGTATGIGTSTPGIGGIVFFPEGTTRISATLDLPSNVHLRGVGWSASCIQLLPNSNCHMITTHRSTGSGNSNAFWSSVTNLMLDGRRYNQGTNLYDCTLIPGSTTITSAAGTFSANGTLIQGIGLLPGSKIVSGGGTGTITISQAATYAALQQAPGSSSIYQGGTTDVSGNTIPWCGIYHETNPYNVQQTGDNQFDPTHLFADLRIYYICGDGVRIHGRSDSTLRHIKVTQAAGNGFTVDFDTRLTECMSEFVTGHALQIPGHSADQITNCKFYNSYAHGIYLVGGNGELAFAGVDLQQNNLDGVHLESQKGIIYNGTITQAGFVNASTSVSTATTATWSASKAYNNFRSSGVPSTVTPSSANGYVYACYAAGTSSSSEPTWPTTVGQTVTDGTATWVCLAGLPAAVSLFNSSNNVIDGIAQSDNNALRITGSSTQNTIRLSHISPVTGGKDVSTDSITLLSSGNSVTINGGSLTNSLSSLNDVSFSTLTNGQGLVYNSTLAKWQNSSSGSIFYADLFGNGSDGTVTLDGTTTYTSLFTLSGSTYTMKRDIYVSSLTINSGVTLQTNGGRIFCQSTITNNGIISLVGNTGNASGTAGAATSIASAPFSLLAAGNAGGAGNTGNGTTGSSSYSRIGVGSGGAGGAGSTGSASGTAFAANSGSGWTSVVFPFTTGIIYNGAAINQIGGGCGGGGGGGDGTNKGGGGGGGGGVGCSFSQQFINTGTITVAGGAGGTPTTGNCGGGGGGGGGLFVVYTTTVWSQTGILSAAGGAAGSGVGTGANGIAGTAGNIINVGIS